MNKIVIDDDYCKGCNLCVNVCRKQALQPGSSRSKKGYTMPNALAEHCEACGSCELVCPDFAITIVEGE